MICRFFLIFAAAYLCSVTDARSFTEKRFIPCVIISKATEQITNLKKEDITGESYDRLTALHPTEERDDNGSVVWEFQCECGNIIKMSVYRFRKGKVHSCGCLYNESRKDCITYRKDFVNNTSLSAIVAAKTPSKKNTSGHTGVYLDKRSQMWQAYINYKKRRYYLGSYKDINDAIRARKEGEAKLHDPAIMEHFANLTPERKKEFIDYLKSIGTAIELGCVFDGKE